MDAEALLASRAWGPAHPSQMGACVLRESEFPVPGRARGVPEHPVVRCSSELHSPAAGKVGSVGGGGGASGCGQHVETGTCPCLPYVRFRRLPPGPLVGAVRAAPVLWELPDSCRN